MRFNLTGNRNMEGLPMTDAYTSRADTPADMTQTASGDLLMAERPFEAAMADEDTATLVYCAPVLDRIRTSD